MKQLVGGSGDKPMIEVSYMAETKKGTDWFVGPATKLGRGTQSKWADVAFDDGKLWCRLDEESRGEIWLKLKAAS